MPSPSPSPAPVHPLVAACLPFVGMREGNAALPFATPKRAWCAAFVSSLLVEAGILPAVEWNARALLRLLARLGYSTDHRAPAAGDVVGWPRPTAGPDAGHVGIVVEVAGDRVRVVSGNSAPEGSRRADRVTDRWYPAGKIRWAARPMPQPT